jgi:hypothetical protein
MLTLTIKIPLDPVMNMVTGQDIVQALNQFNDHLCRSFGDTPLTPRNGTIEDVYDRTVGRWTVEEWRYRENMTDTDLNFMRGLYERVQDGEILAAGENYAFLDGDRVVERKATPDEIGEVVIHYLHVQSGQP